jgi:hypothetical protein
MDKNNLETLSQNRLEIVYRLAMDEELAKCLLNKQELFKDTTVTAVEKARLINSQIFPYPKTTGTLVETKSYITMSFNYDTPKGSHTLKTASIVIYAFCSDALVTTKYNVLRPDYMVQQIDRLLNDTKTEGWIGKLAFKNMKDIVFDGGYVGLALTYINTEFQ